MCRPDDEGEEVPAPSRRSNLMEVDEEEDAVPTPMSSATQLADGASVEDSNAAPYANDLKESETSEMLESVNSLNDATSQKSPSPSPLTSSSRCRSLRKRLVALYWEHEFLILVVASIGLARAYPPLGMCSLGRPNLISTP
jgi:hypothetical protein